jgi:hypothetical protein
MVRVPGRQDVAILVSFLSGDRRSAPDSGGRRKDDVPNAIRAPRLAPIWVLLATLIIVGLAAGRIAQSTETPSGMVAAFVDLNGNDIDDACETDPIVEDAEAAEAAETAVDLDGDGTISVSEAAQSDRIGGKNCNHGGYVSWVAQGSCADPTTTPEQPALVTGPDPDAAAETTSCDEPVEEPTTEAAEAPTDATCEEVAPPERDPALDEQKNGHGKWVSTVARSDAIGGKNCNHGGAVSEAAKKDQEAAKAAREAAKAEREAARAEKKASREAAKAAREHGKGKSKNH